MQNIYVSFSKHRCFEKGILYCNKLHHQHHVLIPEKMRRLKPGDRVLVAWVQSEAVVVDIICPAEDLKK